MIDLCNTLNSIEDVLVIGAIALLLLMISLGRRSARSSAPVWQEENGGTYSLSLVLVTPVYALLICLIIETALVCVVKLGTLYSSYCAARSAMVWLPAEVPHPEKIQLAAVQAMTPFASSLKEHIISENVPVGSKVAGEAYDRAYRNTPFATQSETYVLRKRAYALQATEVTINLEYDERHTESSLRSDDDQVKRKPKVTATVAYEFPISVPGVGRIFGKRSSLPGASFYSRIITSTTTLDLDSPISRDHRLGIGYDSDYQAQP